MATAPAVEETLLVAARRASEEMEDALHAVVHELRAPLAVASGYVRMLRDGTIEPTPAPNGHPLDIVEDKLAECRRLVNELLLAARREQAPVRARTVVDLAALARQAVDRAWPRALLVGGRLSLESPPHPVAAAADAAQVERILNNVIGNALDHGGAHPEVTITAGHDSAPFVSVSDRGPGVLGRDRERIFDRFVHGEMSRGVGLGLYLSRRLATACGGSLELDDEFVGPGARFVLRLPDPRPRATRPARNGRH